VPCSDDALQLVESTAPGYPYFTADHVRAGAVQASAQSNAMDEAGWHAGSEQEQNLTQAVALHPDEDVPRAVVVQAVGRASRANSVPQDRLIDKGIVESPTPRPRSLHPARLRGLHPRTDRPRCRSEVRLCCTNR